MRKIWKKILVYALTGAMAVTSLSGIGMVKASAEEQTESAVGTSIRAQSTAEVTIKDNPQAFRDLSSDELIQEMGIGWNLGNTMDGHGNFMPSETAWQSTVTTKSMIKAVHDMGFNTIRIPITWGMMINDDYSVDEKWMSRVQEIVDYAIAQGMYVMINTHHDGADNGGHIDGAGWLHLNGDDETFEKQKVKFAGLWTTIAERFKNYDEHLIMAGFNENYIIEKVLNKKGKLEEMNYGWSNDADIVNREYKYINELNQVFVDTVRATGSNNAKRWLCAQGVNTQISKMIDPDKFEFVVPTDAAKHVMVEGHDYDPIVSDTCDENASKSKGAYAYQFKKLKELYVDNGIPVVIGEFGFIGAQKKSINYETVSYLLKKYDIIGCIWDNAGSQGTSDNYIIVDRANEKSYDKTFSDALMRGYFVTKTKSALGATDISEITSFDVSSTDINVEMGTTTDVEVSNVEPSNTKDLLLWKSDDASIASVYDGKILGRRIGTTTITAFSQANPEVTKTITVNVTSKQLEQATESIKTDFDTYQLEEGKAGYLNASVEPAGNGAGLAYSTSDESVVSVSNDGRMLAGKTGAATVSAISSDGIVKEIPVTVIEAVPSAEFNIRLAINILYNDKVNNYYQTEISSDVVELRRDGVYTLKFDCDTDLSEAAKSAGVSTLNNVGAIYIKDYDVTLGNTKRSPEYLGKISYNSIKVNGKELLSHSTPNQDAVKAGIFDTGNPFNVWDGSVVEDGEGITSDTKDNFISFAEENPKTLEIKFTLSGFTGSVIEPEIPEVTEAPTEAPTEVPTETPSETPATSAVPTAQVPTSSAVVPTQDAIQSNNATIGKGVYDITNAAKKTVTYVAPVNKKIISAVIPATVKVEVDGKKVSCKVTKIKANAFKNCKKLKSVTIGKNIVSIGANAFAGCSKLKTIKVKTTKLKTVGKNAFKGINKKCKIYLPKKQYKKYKKTFLKKGCKKTMKFVKK